MIDVARLAGVSRAAVSYVLMGARGGQARVGEEKTKLIRRAAAELRYKPNYAARRLKGKSPAVLGMISSDWRDHFQLRVFCWVQGATSARDYQVLTAEASSLRNGFCPVASS